jgi:hypothetical protein
MIYIHIGTSKTGSKSIQRFLGEHREQLLENGYSYFRGRYPNPDNHTELHLATLRDERDSLGRLKWPETRGAVYKRDITSNVQRFLRQCTTPHALFSNEGLSWLRYPDELEQLAEMMTGVGAEPLTFILYLRNKSDFLHSYANQIRKAPGREPSDDPNSCLYIARNSWIVDYQTLIDAYAKRFGRQSMIVLDYDKEVATNGTVLPSLQQALNLPPEARFESNHYFLNRSLYP